MPTYDYRCENGHTFEVFHGIKDDSPRRCPQCDAPAKRVPGGGGGLLFKGQGFYITDNRSSSYKEGAKAEGPAPPAKPAAEGGKPRPASEGGKSRSAPEGGKSKSE